MAMSSLSLSLSSPQTSLFLRTSILRFHGNISNYMTIAKTSIKNNNNNKNKKPKTQSKSTVKCKARLEFTSSSSSDEKLKRRTRSEKEFDAESVVQYGDVGSHVPVMLGEVLEVFSRSKMRSFVDCTVGAAGHSTAIIRAHPHMQHYIGLDVDPVAHERARGRISSILDDDSYRLTSDLKVHMCSKNFKYIKSVLMEVDETLVTTGVDGIIMDLGMSSMQVNDAERGFSVLGDGPLDMRMNPLDSLKAEDILNSWPDMEVGRILREYGEESNWRALQNKIVKARLDGGLHSTSELVDLIRNSTARTKGGRQGWIKTATRVFQALRIAVNDELQTLEDSLYACFDCLAPGGRLAVISFHSLEDRIVKQTFLDIINSNKGDDQDPFEDERHKAKSDGNEETELWIKQIIEGCSGRILTKRPITPSEEEEKLNRRSRSAKLRVIEKL